MIKGLTPRLAEAGKIKIGGLGTPRKSRGGKEWRPPIKLDHFLITKTTRDQKKDLIIDTDLMACLGKDPDGKLRAIPIVVHDDDLDQVFATSYALYSGRRCACRGDGAVAVQKEIQDGRYTGRTKNLDCPCDYLGAENGPRCKPNGKLCCSIIAKGAAIAGAVHVWRTTSIISVERMWGSLLQIRELCGTLIGVPLWLRVEPVRVEPPNAPASTVYCCHVELRAADIEAVQRRALEAARLRQQLGGRQKVMLLPPADDAEPIGEQADVAGEFYADDESNRTELPMAQEADVEEVSKTDPLLDSVQGLMEVIKDKIPAEPSPYRDESYLYPEEPTSEPEPEKPKAEPKPKPTATDKLKNMVGNGKPKATKTKPAPKPEPEAEKETQATDVSPPPPDDDDAPDYGGPERDGDLY